MIPAVIDSPQTSLSTFGTSTWLVVVCVWHELSRIMSPSVNVKWAEWWSRPWRSIEQWGAPMSEGQVSIMMNQCLGIKWALWWTEANWVLWGTLVWRSMSGRMTSSLKIKWLVSGKQVWQSNEQYAELRSEV